MNRFALNPILIVALILVALMALAGCGILPFGQTTPPTRTPVAFPTPLPTSIPMTPTLVVPPTSTPVPVLSSATRAATLRVTLERYLGEHMALLAMMTQAAFDARSAEFKANSDALDANSVEISKAVGQIYGPDVEKQFLAAWRRHIGLFIDYDAAVITKDKAKQDKAINDLNAYADGFGDLLNKVNPKLDKAAVAGLFKTHISTIKDVIDAQNAKDWPKTYASARKAFGHMDMVALALAAGIASNAPDKFGGNPDAAGAKLRDSLTGLLTEHVYLASAATHAALNARDSEFRAAADALDQNSVDLSKAIGSLYGADAEKNFLTLWRKHIGLVVDYTTAIVKKDKAAQDKAFNDLTAYAGEFGKFLETATNKGLPAAAVTDLVKTHLTTLKDVIDAQAARDYPKTSGNFRTAFAHMAMIADPLADAIVKQLPDKFK
jgi:hypothetical protein